MNSELNDKIERYQSFFSQDTTNVNLACELLDLYLQAQNVTAAIDFFEANKEQFADQPVFLFKASNAFMAETRFEEAIACLSKLKSLGVSQLAIDYNLAFALFYNRQFAEAATTISPLVENWREYPPIALLASRIFHFVNRLDEAVAVLQAYIADYTDDAEAIGLLSLIMMDNDNATVAEQNELAEKALAKNPDQLEALLVLSQNALAEQDLDKIENTVERAVTSHPKSGRAWSYKGQSDLLTLDFVKAEASLDKAVKFMPDHIGTWHALAWCTLLRGNQEKAQHCFNEALKLDRNFAESHGGMALMNYLHGELDEAKKNIRRALGLDKNCFSARYTQALLLEKEGKPEEAVKLIENIFASDTGAQAKVFIQLLRERNPDLQPKLQ